MEICACQIAVSDLTDVAAQLPRNVFCHGKRAAQNFECVESKAVAFIFHIQISDSQMLRHCG